MIHRAAVLPQVILVLLLLPPLSAAADQAACSGPPSPEVLTEGRRTLRTDGPAMPGSTTRATAPTVQVVVDAAATGAARLDIEIDWSNPHELYHFYVLNERGDEHKEAVRAGTTATGERTRQATSVLVEHCETITIEVLQVAGSNLEPVAVDFTVTPHQTPGLRDADGGADDVVVVAVIDSGFNPYHLEFRADGMPGPRLPLDRAPHEWISGFPEPAVAFADYRPLDLTLPLDPDAVVTDARLADQAEWDSAAESTSDATSFYWVPGTKAVGAVDFSGAWASGGEDPHDPNNQHASRMASLAVGNTLGHCPECVYVAVVTDLGDEPQAAAARRWAHAQPWIDVISDASWTNDARRVFPEGTRVGGNSGTSLAADPLPSLDAAIRGQQRFMAAGNGMTGVDGMTNSSYLTEAGFDWVTTVGGIMDTSSDYANFGRNVDVAATGWDWRVTAGATVSSYGAGDSGSRGTSPATAAIAGTYARSLAIARAVLPGPSRVQAGGVIATGAPRPCGCALADGQLTRDELLDHLHSAAVLIDFDKQGLATAQTAPSTPSTPLDREQALLAQGHGTFFGRHFGDVAWHDEIDRIVAPLLGEATSTRLDAYVVEFMTVDSFCRQQIWGAWDGGYYRTDITPLPGADADWPVRSTLEAGCAAALRMM